MRSQQLHIISSAIVCIGCTQVLDRLKQVGPPANPFAALASIFFAWSSTPRLGTARHAHDIVLMQTKEPLGCETAATTKIEAQKGFKGRLRSFWKNVLQSIKGRDLKANALLMCTTTVRSEGERDPNYFTFAQGDVCVKVEQVRGSHHGCLDEDSTGDLVWPTAIIFSRFLCDNASLLKNRRVLDMGAGTGLVGLVAAQLGGITALVDVPRVLPLLVRNVESASAKSSHRNFADRVSVKPLFWGDADHISALTSEHGVFDVILCCEVIYQQPLEVLDALRCTLEKLIATPDGILVFAYQQRDGAEASDYLFFEKLALSFELVSSTSLSDWDESWDDSDIRWVRTYRRRPEAASM